MMFSTRYCFICGFFLQFIAVIQPTTHAFVTIIPVVTRQQQYVLSSSFEQRNQQQQQQQNHQRNHRFWGQIEQRQQQNCCRRPARNVVFSGPSVLDRPTVIEEETTTRQKTHRKQRQSKSSSTTTTTRKDDETWEVRLYNDGLNTREHVSKSLVHVTGLSEYQAYNIMMTAHHNGMAVVGQYYYEIAEMFHDALKLEGIICDIIPVE